MECFPSDLLAAELDGVPEAHQQVSFGTARPGGEGGGEEAGGQEEACASHLEMTDCVPGSSFFSLPVPEMDRLQTTDYTLEELSVELTYLRN